MKLTVKRLYDTSWIKPLSKDYSYSVKAKDRARVKKVNSEVWKRFIEKHKPTT